MIFRLLVVFIINIAALSNFSFASTQTESFCEAILKETVSSKSVDDLYDQLDAVDTALMVISSEFTTLDLSTYKQRLENIVDKSLNEEKLGVLKEDLLLLLNEIKVAMAEVGAVSEHLNDSKLTDLIRSPRSLDEKVDYYSQSGLLINFEEKAIKEIVNLDMQTFIRLLRAIQKGFVPAHGGTGIYRATDVHTKFIEVKIVGRGIKRLVGCLDGRKLIIKRVYAKQNEGKGGSLSKFKKLCH